MVLAMLPPPSVRCGAAERKECNPMRKWIGISALVILCILVVVGGGGYLWFQWRLTSALPQVSGEIIVKGVNEPVEIIRDDYGVPHIYAKNEKDLYFVFGYAMAQDRLWQMEFFRRLGRGRLSEILGQKFVAVDRYFRMITAAGVNSNVSKEVAPLLESFAAGINAFMDSHRDRLPIEFTLLRFTPSPWQMDDYIAILKVVNWSLSSGWRADITAHRMLEKVGAERLKEAFPGWPGNAPIVITGGKLLRAGHDPTQKVLALLEGMLPLGGPGASNNWVVSGDRSSSGKPILATQV
jgi:penicillin amidase